uniref:Uncharacterized protein n=2 Tax=Leersia perrieri TaxID=77586 RepID=A0A0D9XQS5_9ORYZ
SVPAPFLSTAGVRFSTGEPPPPGASPRRRHCQPSCLASSFLRCLVTIPSTGRPPAASVGPYPHSRGLPLSGRGAPSRLRRRRCRRIIADPKLSRLLKDPRFGGSGPLKLLGTITGYV